MSNATKWIVAIPFALLLSLAVPGLVAGRLQWFTDSWTGILYVACTAGMWLIATAFVDLNRPRSAPDLANRLIPIGLVLSVPVAVWDQVHGIASRLPSYVNLSGLFVGLVAIFVGVWSRVCLGQEYSPGPARAVHSSLVQSGPYRWIRHPMYLSALLWSAGWPLLIASLLGAIAALSFITPAVVIRMKSEERELAKAYGEDFEDYAKRTWRLIPGLY